MPSHIMEQIQSDNQAIIREDFENITAVSCCIVGALCLHFRPFPPLHTPSVIIRKMRFLSPRKSKAK